MKGIRHFGIVVSDLEKSLNFYKNLLDLKIVKEMNEAGEYIDKILALSKVKVKTVKMAADDNSLIELVYFKSHPRTSDRKKEIYETGCSHVAFSVDDIDKVYKRMKENGVYFNSFPQMSPDGYAKVAFCKDPDGNFIELVEVLT